MRQSCPKLRPHPIAAAAIAAIGLTNVQAADVTWVGPNASFWNLATNWNPGLPGVSDRALLGAFDTTFQSGTVSILSFSGTGTLTMNGGILRTSQNSSIGNLAFNAGTLSGLGTITTGTLNWSGGTMGESGQGGGTTTVTGATTIDGTASNALYYGRTLNLNGNTSWTAGSGALYVYSAGQGNSTLNIASGTAFVDSGAATAAGIKYLGYYGDGVVNNAGTYSRGGLGTTSTLQGQFNNTGSVNVNAGTFAVGGGTSTGTYTVASGATLSFINGVNNINGGTLTNNGTLLMTSGTANLAAAATYAGTGAINIAGGVFNSAVGSAIGPASLTISGGTGRFAGNVNTSALTLTAGILGGPGVVTATSLNWSGGTMGETGQGGGTTTITGTSTIDGTGANYLYYGRTLNLNGNTNWTAGTGSIYVYSAGQGNSTLNIGAGATFTDAGGTGTRYLGYYGDGVVNNAGTYNRTGAGTTLTNTGAFNNTGTVNVSGGTLGLGGGTSTGAYTVASGATLNFTSGTNNLNGGTLTNNGTLQMGGGTANVSAATTYAGTGALVITGGLLNSAVGSTIAPASMTISGGTGRFAGSVNTGALTMTGGILSGSGTVTAGSLDWSGGTMGENAQGGGTTTITGASVIDGTAANSVYYGRTLNLKGNTSWTAGNSVIYVYSAGQGNSALNIGAGTTFTDAGASGSTGIKYIGYYGDGSVSNAGTYNRNGVGTTQTNSGAFNNTGSVNVNGGTFGIGGGDSTGTYTIASGATLSFASGTNNLNSGTLTNNGTLVMNGGTANLAAAVNYAGTGTIRIVAGLLNSAVGSTIAPASMSISGGTGRFAGNVNTGALAMTGGILGGPGTLTATSLDWSGGTMGETGQGGGTTTVNGTATLDGTTSNTLYYGRTLNLNGNTAWSAGTGAIYVYSAGQGTSTLNIGAGTTFTDAGASGSTGTRYIGYYSDGLVQNFGTFVRNGVGTTAIADYQNKGTTTVNGGTLRLDGTGSSSGAFSVAAGSVLQFASGTFGLTGGSLANGGTTRISGGLVSLSAPLATSGAGVLEMTGGTLRMLAGSSMSPSNVNFTGGIVDGPGTINAGALTWSGGRMGENAQTGGNFNVAGATAIDGTALEYLWYGHTLSLNGNTSWSAGNGALYIYSVGQGTSTLNLAAGKTFTDAGAATSAGTKYLGYYADGIVNNAGTYVRNGAGVTAVAPMNNTGTVTVNAGTLRFDGAGTSTGTLNVAAGATVEFSATPFTLAGGTVVNNGTARVNGGTLFVSAPPAYSGSGVFEMASGGTLRVGSTLTVGDLNFAGGAMGVSGVTNGTTTATGTTNITGTAQQYLYYGHTLNLNGNTNWSAGNGAIYVYSAGQGNSTLNLAAGKTFTDAGAATSTGTKYIGYYADGLTNNAGTYDRNGVGVTSVGPINNTGTINVNAGTLRFDGIGTSTGTLNVAAGATLDFSASPFTLAGGTVVNNGTARVGAGTLFVSAPPTYSGAGLFEMAVGSTLRVGSSFTVGDLNFAGGVMGVSGVTNGTTTATGTTTIAGTAQEYLYYGHTLNLNGNTNWSAGNGALYIYSGGQGNSTLNIGAGTIFTDAGAATSTGTKYIGYYNDGLINNAGTYNRAGAGATTVGPMNNSGVFNASAGTTTFQSLQGTGTLQVASGANVVATAANTTVGTLLHNGNTATSLDFGTRTVTVLSDYVNANWGVGNTFNRRANINFTAGAPTARLIAAGDVNQGLSGAGVSNGNTTAPSIVVGNVHVGATTYTYNIDNTGTSGPSLRGAIQNAANGGNITDARLSGNGVLSSNWGPVAPGESTSRDITVTIGTAGVYTPIAGQAVSIVNNFENTRNQLLTITSATGAAAYNLAAAAPITPNPVNLGNQRVGGTAAGALTIANTAPAGSFTERLNASFGTTTGAALGNGGSVALLAAGASNNSAMAVRLDGTTAGAKTGTVQVNLASDGTGSSGLGLTALTPQSITVNGAFYNTAVGSVTPAPITIANQRVSGSGSQALTIANTAAAGAFSEGLNASFGATTGAATNNGQSLVNLVAGGSQVTGMTAGVNTATAGAKSGTVTVNFASNGAGTSGLAAIAAGSQTINISGNVYQLAAGQLNTAALNFGTVQVGQSVSNGLSVTNSATGAAGFVEDLNVRFGASSGTGAAQISGAGSITGLTAGSTNGTALTVSVDTTTARTISGAITVNYFSAGAVAGVSNGLGEFGVGSSSYGVSGVIETVGQVINRAAPVINTPSINLGNVRVGATSPTQFVSLSNQAGTPPQAALNASISGNAPITASGSVTLLAPGATSSNALQVGMNTANAGAINGTATLALVSDASNVGGCTPNCQVTLASQNVSVSGNVFRLATGAATPTPISFGNIRVGGTAQQTLAVSNASANDGFSESLNAAFGTSTGSTVTTAGTVSQLQAGAAASTAMSVTLGTATAGAKSGTVSLNYASDGTGTTGLAALANGSQTVNFSGNVYQLAAGQLNGVALNFGTVQVGQTVSNLLSVTNSASGPGGYVEDLNARFGASSGTGASQIVGTGSITGLTAGSTNNSALTVSVDTTTAGTINGAIAVNYFSAGAVSGVSNGLGEVAVGSQNYGVSGAIQTITQVINQAAPVINTPSINLGNVRIGSTSPTQFVSLTNQATVAPQAALNATISGNSPITASGSVNLLAPGATNNNALQVGMNTANAGAISGTATLALVSDASNVGGCTPNCQLTLASKTVDVSGAVYRLASPSVTTGAISLAARVGDAAPTSSIGVTNVSPDIYTERLNASMGTVPVGFGHGGGSITGLAAGASSNAIGVSLITLTAGTFSGQASLAFTSSGAGTTGAADASLAGQNVALSGRVYAPAVGQVNTTTVDFGIVHRGDTVAARNVSVTNAATVLALNDDLRGSFGGASGPFTASGALAGVAAGATDASSFNVTLNTANAGIYTGSASAALASHNAELVDLALGSTAVGLKGQVNNFAELALGKLTGNGTLTHVGSTYTLDFGSLRLGSTTNLAAELVIFNLATGPADVLNGSFTLGSGTAFTLGGFDSFSGIAAGTSLAGYSIGFGSATLGDFTRTITIAANGSNASGFVGSLGDTTLVLHGNVVAVPEPGTWALYASGLLGLWFVSRRKLRHSRGDLA